MNNDIKVLLFDLGGVVIDIDPKKAISELKKISSKTVTEFKELDYRYETFNSDLSKLFNAYEKGEISDQVFRNGLRTAGNLDLDDKNIDEIWNLVIVKIHSDILEIILQLKSKYLIMILSNTNSIHRNFFDKLCIDLYQKTFEQLFDNVFYSFKLKCRKPDKEIYEKVVEKSKYLPSEILFFDDMIENLSECKKMGMSTYHVKSTLELKSFLSNLILN